MGQYAGTKKVADDMGKLVQSIQTDLNHNRKQLSTIQQAEELKKSQTLKVVTGHIDLPDAPSVKSITPQEISTTLVPSLQAPIISSRLEPPTQAESASQSVALVQDQTSQGVVLESKGRTNSNKQLQSSPNLTSTTSHPAVTQQKLSHSNSNQPDTLAKQSSHQNNAQGQSPGQSRTSRRRRQRKLKV